MTRKTVPSDFSGVSSQSGDTEPTQVVQFEGYPLPLYPGGRSNISPQEWWTIVKVRHTSVRTFQTSDSSLVYQICRWSLVFRRWGRSTVRPQQPTTPTLYVVTEDSRTEVGRPLYNQAVRRIETSRWVCRTSWPRKTSGSTPTREVGSNKRRQLLSPRTGEGVDGLITCRGLRAEEELLSKDNRQQERDSVL